MKAKKILLFILSVLIILLLLACSNNQASEQDNEQTSINTPEADISEAFEISSKPENNAKILVVYFSMPETANPNNMTTDEDNSVVVINGEVLGNTQYLAYLIQEKTTADIFRLEAKMPYPTNHSNLVDLAKEEQNAKARPELLSKIENIEQYDVIFLGYPNWWGDMPMIIYTFLESVDLSGKTIIPFNTHGGSGFSDTINTIASLQPNSTVEQNGFSVSRNAVEDCEEDVAEWLKSINSIN